jgi:hypothetical protein
MFFCIVIRLTVNDFEKHKYLGVKYLHIFYFLFLKIILSQIIFLKKSNSR